MRYHKLQTEDQKCSVLPSFSPPVELLATKENLGSVPNCLLDARCRNRLQFHTEFPYV